MAVATDGLNLLQPVIQFPGPGGLSHRVVSRVPLHVAGYHSVEGYPCAHLEPGVPRQLFLPVWRQLFLPVHLLGLAPLLGCIGAVAGDVKLQDDGVMDHSIDGRGGGHGVGEDVFPLREDQV